MIFKYFYFLEEIKSIQDILVTSITMSVYKRKKTERIDHHEEQDQAEVK